jgi:hypothetical protein
MPVLAHVSHSSLKKTEIEAEAEERERAIEREKERRKVTTWLFRTAHPQ